MSDSDCCVIEIKEEPDDYHSDHSSDIIEVKIEDLERENKGNFRNPFLESLIDVKSELLEEDGEQEVGGSQRKRRSRPAQKNCSCCSR
jgi:hypothetical protein